MGEPQYNSPSDPKVMYAFKGMYDSLLETATETVLHLRNASLSIASSEKGEEHKRVRDAWDIESLVERGYWHDLIKDMSQTKTAGTLESVQQFLERLQELLHQLLDQMKDNNISFTTKFDDAFILQLNDVMGDFYKVASTTDALLTSFNRPKTPEPVEELAVRAFSASPPSSSENEHEEAAVHPEPKPEKSSPEYERRPFRRPTRRRHHLRPHKAHLVQSKPEHDPKTSSDPLPNNILQSLTPRLSE